MSCRMNTIKGRCPVYRIMLSTDILALLSDARDSLDGLYGVVELRREESMLVGNIEEKDGRFCFYVGTGELVDNPDREFPIGLAMVPVVGLFHEVHGHGAQRCVEFQKTTPFSGILALNDCACRISSAYYGVDGMNIASGAYFCQLHEIAAQYAGIRAARDWLSDRYGPEGANDMLCAYLKYRVSLRSEFIRPLPGYDPKSVDEELERFNRTFQKQVFARRAYNPLTDPECPIINYARAHHDRTVMARFLGCMDGVRQDAMMAYAGEMFSPVIRDLLRVPAIRSLGLSAGRLFGKPGKVFDTKPAKSDLSLDQLYYRLVSQVRGAEEDTDLEYP